MWRNLSRQSYLRKLKFLTESHPSLNAFSAVRSPQDSLFVEKATPFQPQSHVNTRNFGSGFSQDLIFWRKCDMSRLKYASSCDPFGFFGNTRGYATAAEAFVSTSEEEVDEIQELIEEVNKEMKVKSLDITENKQPKMVGGMGLGKYNSLRRRQIKMETEAWEEAAREYQELLVDMCEQKLAPNLPYIKSLFLGWFEPLKDAIAAEQDLCKEGKNRGAYAPYFDQLPADMMAVITMHKLMGLLMTGGWNGSARVVQAACHIGEAIEHEVRIHKFLENCKRKNALNRTSEEGPDPEAKEQERLSKKVKMLMKKQKLHQVRKIVRQQDDLKPWGQDAQVKVGCRLIQILTQTAYIQPPVDQMDDAPPDIRPAFVHTLKSVETVKGTRRYGVIECDPLVCKGLEKTARHMVIPYMPMLVPPLNWTGYERGAYLFLPSYMMRTHGAKQQRDAVKRAPKLQLEPIFQVNQFFTFRDQCSLMIFTESGLMEAVLPIWLTVKIVKLKPQKNVSCCLSSSISSQISNVYGGGVDKLSYEGRVSFTENHLEDIFDSADRPLEGKRWWLGAEDPFQCLATCINLSEALRSPYPESTVSHMPVHQDGSCNGLQHYAALGRDKVMNSITFLTMIPVDNENCLQRRVLDIMKRDAAKDPATDPNVMRARLLINQVDRKLVKQTVMTSVYGVTYIGARDQIKRRLKERGAIDDDTEVFACACYAAKTTLTALGEMFEAARSIMSWLGDCAKIIATENQPVRWTTPLGLPVVQPYRKLGRHMIKTSLQVLTLQRETDKVLAKLFCFVI
ncbi:DNA-directed RNA polymerase 1, mitochondrial-like [Sesamum indicum]|uniref:DNA-directed RNA polymerase n=2 Tax=Sesamum indicum TaxID=4182 RepID=A0A6I9UQH9_SESIN|nr:DNA-directed RNA polymerase 1, mitochondrial-like [Sesamum indicum]